MVLLIHDSLLISSYFPRCHPLSPPRTPHVTPPTPVGPGTPPAARKQVSHRRFRLWSAPNPASAPRCSPLLVAPPQYTLNPRSAVGRDPRRPPMPGLPALDFPLMHRRFPQPACVASAPRAFRISATSIPHAPNKLAKALAKARSRHHIPPTLKILSPGSSSPNFLPILPSSHHFHLLQLSKPQHYLRPPDSHGLPRPPKRPRTTTRGNSLDDFVVPDSASVSVASPTPSSCPPSPPPQPPQSSPESPAGSDRMTPRPHESDFSSRPPPLGQPISDSPAPPSAPAADLQVVPRRPTPERVLSPPPVRSPVLANTTIDIEPIGISSGPPSPMSRSPVTRSPAVSPTRVDPEPEGLHPTPPPSVGAAPDHTTPNSSPPPLLDPPNEDLPRFRKYPTDPNDPALRELFPDEDNGVFDAIPADAVEAVLVDIQGRFETILSASVLPPSLRRSTYAAFLSDLRDLRRHRLQVMAVFNPRLADYPDGNGDGPAPNSSSS
ncbi:hypothetical protein PGT21_012300 [Puccinia graminis f. sp. tritici]|uniref:Uncharacterized protein n=1 Tax=Puccinia graminis f. sp. tritici TaxID=56615 RepID=A0A5B0MTN2_PUCGR|nr:hypothetical protein PGT21_012300 [Puccinia graminis f. sp. tritici]